MISTQHKQPEEDKDLVQMKARDMQALVKAIELLKIDSTELKVGTSPREREDVIKAALKKIDQRSLHRAMEAARMQLDEVHVEQGEPIPQLKLNLENQQSPFSKIATSLSSSVTLGIAASALAPMAIGGPLVAAALGAVLGWFVADKALHLKEKKVEAKL